MRSYIPIILILFIFSPSILVLVEGRSTPVVWYDLTIILSRLVIALWMFWIFHLDKMQNAKKLNSIGIVFLVVYFGVTISKVLFGYTDYILPRILGRFDFFTIIEIGVGFICLIFLFFPAKRLLPERSSWFIVFELLILPFAIYNWTQHILIEGLDQTPTNNNDELLDK